MAESRPDYREAVRRSGLIDLLAAFDPHVAGTLPLGVGMPNSDIDILCHAPDAVVFADIVWRHCRDWRSFSMRQWTGDGRPLIASFDVLGWPFELFAAAEPVAEQAGWCHFMVERRLLDLGGDAFRTLVLRHRRTGLKTEPAFAAALALTGDPYAAMLDLADRDDAVLARLLADALS